ncbi:Nuclear factor of activated T-cells, cytoplasmic 2 [Liparis tanakae]|uniref:Nuclear factor of activated T-cells, cytoplasmic 2 n=1 Tax=Liparis tanakae TaxID=230148 RepID=A0A4Z2EN68_9TELE|nr:Nuclear factor of activated T-cells, cytoplasmic 2 [Liparis tanakae]
MVEKQDMDSCSVLGGQQMILTGQNFSSDSKFLLFAPPPSHLRTRLSHKESGEP